MISIGVGFDYVFVVGLGLVYVLRYFVGGYFIYGGILWVGV